MTKVVLRTLWLLLVASTLWTTAGFALPLQLTDVLKSAAASHPKLLSGAAKIDAAKGSALSANGAFDLEMYAEGTYSPVGKYSEPRGEVGLKQPTPLWGAKFYAKYENGEDFAPYDGALVTSEAGKASLGVLLPLLQGRAIDSSRFNQLRTSIEVAIAEQTLRSVQADVLAAAASAWWKWVVAGKKLSIQQLLLKQAEARQEFLIEQVKVGAIPNIEVADNERLVAQRRAKLVALEWEFVQQSLHLGLYYRDNTGRPQRVGIEHLPQQPLATFSPNLSLDALLSSLESSPGAQIYRKTLTALDAELSLANNAQLPQLDVEVFGSRSFGDVRRYSAIDTTITETVIGGRLRWSLDVQRREARGKARTVHAKRLALEQELELVVQTLRAQAEASFSALRAQHEVTQLNRAATLLSTRVTEAETESFKHGQSSVLAVNLREQAEAAAYLSEAESTLDFHLAWIELQRLLGKNETSDYLPELMSATAPNLSSEPGQP